MLIAGYYKALVLVFEVLNQAFELQVPIGGKMMDAISGLFDIFSRTLNLFKKVVKNGNQVIVLVFLQAIQAVKFLAMVWAVAVQADVGHSVHGVAAALR